MAGEPRITPEDRALMEARDANGQPLRAFDYHARVAAEHAAAEWATARIVDPKAAGWWVWGIGLWIGGGWCSGDGPWRVEDGQLLHAGDDGQGVHRQLLHAGDDGRGDARVVGWRADRLLAAFEPLAERLRDALIMCGDWSRVVTPAVMFGTGTGRSGADAACAVFLDPPYPHDQSDSGAVYAKDSAGDVAYAARDWALVNGSDPRLRIALCGYEGQWDMPGWTEVAWSAKGGYGSGRGGKADANRRRERIWFSPSCHAVSLWDIA